MFTPFFYLLRAHGLNITTHEWLTFLDGLSDGLHHSTMNGFYQLGLATLCKSESDYDRFQQAFSEYFYDAEVHTATGEIRAEITQELLNWLNDPKVLYERFTRDDVTEEMLNRTQEEIERMLRERLKEQRCEHNGGNYWIGTHGISPFGNDGYNPNGIRVGGVSKDRAALRVAGERTYRDFRDDNMLDIRQFQMAFRRLCHYSDQNGQEEEFDVDRTIHDTCQKAGILQIRYKKPRRNTIKVLLLIDSGGSMDYHSQICSQLFQAASRSNRFKELRVYYFHNCPKVYLYTNPTLEKQYRVPMEKVLRECDKDFKVLLLGDATMDIDDLVRPPFFETTENKGYTGVDWLNCILRRYAHAAWLNPRPTTRPVIFGKESYYLLYKMFDMYPLTIAGLESALKKLMVRE